MIKYLGSKRLFVPLITEVVAGLGDVRSVVDLFSGTSRVGHALKARGYRVLANDHNAYARALAGCYVRADAEDVSREAAQLVGEFNAMPGKAGYFTETFCVRSRFFQPKNGERVDAIREAIAAKGLRPALEDVMLVSLMEAADRVDSTTGVQMAYLEDWAPRASKDLELRVPEVLPRARHGQGEAHQLDALDAAARLEADLFYLDPPYNQHKYLGNYHAWESLVRWDKPEVYGVACKRVDCRERGSAFNSRPRAFDALRRVVATARCRYLLVSFSDEGFVSREELEALLATRGEVTVLERDYKRYVGAQIGIYNPRGEKVGKAGKLRNREYLFLVGAARVRATPPSLPAESLPAAAASDPG